MARDKKENEIFNSVQESVGILDTSAGNLALDVIQTVGPRGHFLREKHTRDYFRKLHFSDVVLVPDTGGSYR